MEAFKLNNVDQCSLCRQDSQILFMSLSFSAFGRNVDKLWQTAKQATLECLNGWIPSIHVGMATLFVLVWGCSWWMQIDRRSHGMYGILRSVLQRFLLDQLKPGDQQDFPWCSTYAAVVISVSTTQCGGTPSRNRKQGGYLVGGKVSWASAPFTPLPSVTNLDS